MPMVNALLPFDAAPPGRPVPKVLLTPRQRQVICLIAEGLSNKEIAGKLNIAVHTVKTHVHTVLTTLRVRSRLELAVLVYTGDLDPAAEDTPQFA